MACHSVPFAGYMAWNYLDLGAIGVDKEFEGIDMVINGQAEVSLGYDQRKGQEALATTAYAVDGDTVVGMGLLPFPLTAPSLQVRIAFPIQDQTWEWFATNVYKLGEYGT